MEKSATKFVSREYTVPVQAVNEMAEKLGRSIISRYNEETSKYLLEFAREKSKLLHTLKLISEKTIEFDIENYRKERKRLLKPPPPPDIIIPKKVLQAVPANCVLDFGPGNTIMYLNGANNKKGVIPRNSVITNPQKRKTNRIRPFTAIPTGSKRPKSVAFGKSGRNTSLGFAESSGRNSALEVTASSGRNTPFRQQSSRIRKELHNDRKNDRDANEEPFVEYNHKNSHKWEMPNRSYRQLKQMYTYTEEEKPDLTAERFKMMKLKESAYFQYLEEKVREFHV